MATLTSKGQLTLPKQVRDHLKVHAGDTVDFVFADGRIEVRAGSVDVRELRGVLRKSGRAAVPLEAMDEAIRAARRTRP